MYANNTYHVVSFICWFSRIQFGCCACILCWFWFNLCILLWNFKFTAFNEIYTVYVRSAFVVYQLTSLVCLFHFHEISQLLNFISVERIEKSEVLQKCNFAVHFFFQLYSHDFLIIWFFKNTKVCVLGAGDSGCSSLRIDEGELSKALTFVDGHNDSEKLDIQYASFFFVITICFQKPP